MNDFTPAAEQCGGKPNDHTQWKPSAASLGTDPTTQRTIPELFGSSRQKFPAQVVIEPSPSKRLKLSHSTSDMSGLDSERKKEIDSTEATSSRPGIVDLTKSNSVSPANASPTKIKDNGVVRPVGFGQSKELKKFVVKNLRKTPKTDLTLYYEKVWIQLEAAISAIFRDEKIHCSKEELYTGVEILCRQGRAPWLYTKLCEKCRNEVTRWSKEPFSDENLEDKDVDILHLVVEAWLRWTNHIVGKRWLCQFCVDTHVGQAIIRSIFFYLDRSYLLHSLSQASIGDMGVTEFRTYVFSDAKLKPKILQGASDLLRDAREGYDRPEAGSPLRKAVDMFRVLGVYTKELEPKLMGESERFFLAWGKKNSSKSLTEYVEGCQELIDLEVQRCELFGLGAATRRMLETYLEDILVELRQTKLLEVEEVSRLLGKNEVDVLKQLYSLLQRKCLGEKLKPAFEAYIIKQGSDIVFDEKREYEMVVRLLEFKKQLGWVLEHSFQTHEGLGHTLREAFEAFINKNKRSNMNWGTDNPKPGEMIAKYVDMILKGGTKAIPTNVSSVGYVKKEQNEDDIGSGADEDAEITKQLDQVLSLFRFVHGKAVFEAFYKRDLARRLLLQRSASADAEKSMLTRLKSGKVDHIGSLSLLLISIQNAALVLLIT